MPITNAEERADKPNLQRGSERDHNNSAIIPRHSVESSNKPRASLELSSRDGSSPDPFLGQTIRGYTFWRIISSGGAGVVFKVEKDGQEFAAKVSFELDIGSESVRESFTNEYNVLKSVEHKNIIRVFELFEYEGRQIIILEHFEGCDFEQFIYWNSVLGRQRYLKSISRQIVKALKYLHQNGIVHRDIKPANILIGRKNKVKVIDFGGALKLDPSQMVKDRRTTYYTPDFCPPEVLAHDVRSACDQWMYSYDMWSLGVTLYEGLTGTLPYPVESNRLIQRDNFFKGPDLSLIKRLDCRLLSLVKKCLDIQPSTRITAGKALKAKYFRRFL